MNEHFAKGVTLEPVTFKVEGMPEGMSLEDLNVNQQRLIRAMALQQQVNGLLDGRAGLLCMGKLSFYPTYEQARKAQKEIVYVDSQIYLPPGIDLPSEDDVAVYEYRSSQVKAD